MLKTRAAPPLLAVALALLPAPAGAQTATCEVLATSTEQVAPGVTLTYDSSFWCTDAPPSGDYGITVRVANEASSSQAATISDAALSHTSPRPGGSGPQASASASGLPLPLAPGEQGSFQVGGSYELVATDEGDKANLHLRASGRSAAGEAFALGINVHLRGTGATEGDDDGPPPRPEGGPPGRPGSGSLPGSAGEALEGARKWAGSGAAGATLGEAGERASGTGPPGWAPGPPPWAGNDDEGEDEGPPSWAPGPPPWAGRPGS